MAKMQAQIPFPSEFYNTIMILVTIFTVLWGIKAVKRLYYMLRVRSAALTDRIIHIRGLGSYLTYFEGAYQPHLNAIVHTRQTKPAVDTNVVFVPFSVQQAQLKRSFQQNYEVQVNVSTPINSKMVLFYNFKSNSFKNMVSRFRKANPNNVYEDSNSQRIFLENLFQLGGLGGNINGNSKQEIRPSMPANLSGTSEFECIVKDLPKGTHQVSFNLTESMTIALDSRLNAILARPPAPVPVSEPATPAPTAALVADGVGDGLVGPEGPSGNPSSTTSSTRVVEEDAIQIGILIIPSSSFDASRNPLYKPNKKVTSASASASAPQHSSTGNSRSVVPEGQRDSDGPLMEYEMTTSSMHEGLMMTNMASGSGSSGDEENHTQHANGASSSSGSAAVSAAGAVPHVGGSSSSPLPRQAVSCSALYSFAVPLGPLLTASCGPGWTHLRATPSAAQGRVGGAVVAAAAAILPAPLCVSVSVNEMWLFDLSNQLYASQEIFGLGPSAVPPPAAATNTTTAAEVRPAENLLDLGSTKDQLSSSSSSSSSSSGNASAAAPSAASVAAAAVASGGKYVAEDCVVCLTDPKEIALLPCRHLCVCVGCLIYIDKCPVCRAAFEEYVVIQSTKEMPVSVPSLTEPIKL